MKKIIKELANIIQDEIDNKNGINQIGFTATQMQEISDFAKSLSRSGLFIPYPLKNR